VVKWHGFLTVLIPIPGTVVVIAAAQIWNTALVALVASIGGSLGEISGYLEGSLAGHIGVVI